MSTFLGLYNYWIVIFLMMTGFYIVIARGNLVKKVIGLNIFQTGVFLLYITLGKVADGTAPIIHRTDWQDPMYLEILRSADVFFADTLVGTDAWKNPFFLQQRNLHWVSDVVDHNNHLVVIRKRGLD